MKPGQSLTGAAFAVAAFLIWGLSPLYFRAVAGVPALEILAHRVLWSLLLIVFLLALARGWAPVRQACTDRRVLAMLCLSTLLVSINWFIYIWSIEVGRLLEASLGYYINPLVSVLLGVVFLRERLGPLQWAAAALATLGVVDLALEAEAFPWISLTLAFTFGCYGLVRKIAPLESMQGLFMETLLLAPLSLGYLVYLGVQGSGSFAAVSPRLDLLLALSALVTAVPLVCFASAARRLSLSTVGFFQYLTPTCQFLVAVLIFGERLTDTYFQAFLCIWTALALFTFGSLRARRRQALSTASWN